MMIWCSSKHCLLLSMLKTAVLLNIFVETVIRLFKMLWCIENSKEHNLLKQCLCSHSFILNSNLVSLF